MFHYEDTGRVGNLNRFLMKENTRINNRNQNSIELYHASDMSRRLIIRNNYLTATTAAYLQFTATLVEQIYDE
jgi:hypothetical protein